MPRKKLIPNKQTLAEDTVIFAALAGISTVAVIQILGVPTLDARLKTSLYCFAISLPLLSLRLVAIAVESGYKYTVAAPRFIGIATFLGPFVSFAGVAAIFLHFSWIIGGLFIAFSVACVLVVALFKFQVEAANRE